MHRQHVVLQRVRLAHQHHGVQRPAHVDVAHLLERARLDELVVLTHPRHRDAHAVRPVHLLAPRVLHLQHLPRARGAAHEPRRLVLLLPPAQRLDARLLHPNVQQQQRVKAEVRVLLDPVVERVRPPRPGEEADGHRLTEPVQLQAAPGDGVHDGRVVDVLHLAPQTLGPEYQVGVRRGGESITDDQEGHVYLERLVEHAVDALLDELPVRDDNLAAVQSLQPLLGHPQDAGVRLQVYALAPLHSLQAVNGDVLLVTEA
mmetsp:Transcript_1396/g.5298  ORF Transcript_1396/g.5298 Transcript_1396/m.5298 type:complete len:259 (-) Transcript_1396:50-826(-)